MARNIALTLTIDGVQQTITTIGQLETAITQAKAQLAGLEIGSAEFAKLSTQIRQADSALKNLQESIEGKKIEETVGRYAKIGSAITGSFAAAQAAIALFGTESEEVARAAAQAQNLLTIALTGREVAEASVAAATLIADLATKAQTASTLAADSATKRFYATLAANPYTTLLIGVGLLVGALITLTSRTDEAKKKQIELQKAVDESAGKEIAKLKILKETLESETASREQKKEAIEEAKKTFGPYLETLDQEKLITGEITLEYDKLTEALIRKAKAEAFSQEIAKLALKELEIRRQLKKATEDQAKAAKSLKDAEQIGARVTGSGSAPGIGGASATGVTERQRLISADKELDKVQKQLNQNLKEQKIYTDEVTKANEQNFNILGGTAEKVKENNKELKINEETIARLIKTYGQFNLALFQLGESNTDIEKSLQGEIDKVKQLVDGLEDLDTIEEKLVSLQKSLTQQNDAVGDAFDIVRMKSEEFFDQLKDGNATQDEVRKSGELLRQEAVKIAKELSLSPQNTEQLERYVLLYAQFTDAVAKFQNTDIAPPFNAAKFEKDLIDVQLLTGKIKIDPYSFLDPSDPNYRSPEDLQKDLLDAQERLQRDQEGFIKSYIANRKKEAEKEIKGLNAAELAEFEKTLGEAGKQAFENLVNVGTQVIIFEDGIEKVRLNVEKLNEQLAKLEPQARRALIVENIDLISDQYQGILENIELNEENVLELKEKLRRRDYSEEEKYRETLVSLQKSLLDKGIDISTLSYEEKLRLLESFLAKEVEAVENAEKKKEDATQKSLEKISNAIQQFQAIVTQIQQTAADYFSFQLDQLDKQNEYIQSKIVGDTEVANKKRLEQEQIYQNKRKELEKKQAKTSLGLQLVQGVSNTALAIIRALSEGGPIAGPILASIIGAIGAVQVGIIGAQLAAVDKYKRGGFLTMEGGGWVTGPSHEYGGVKFAAGGFELEGNEAVINRQSSLNYMGLLDQINQSGGGKPIFNNFDDSRIVEAIYKQRKEPIRAYVVESDITNKQQITRRLEQLAQF